MITLKKSFEVQNYLKKLSDEIIVILGYPANITVITQEHMRKKAFAEAEDEIIVKPKTTDCASDVGELIDFACYLQDESEKLTIAINKAKTANGQDFDGMIAVNNRKRMLLNRLVTMANVKASETITTGKATKFNGEGNQTVYCYDIKEVTTIDFDRNKVKAIANRLRKELDDTSTKIDVMQLETMVEYETELDIGDNLEDAIEKWKVSKN